MILKFLIEIISFLGVSFAQIVLSAIGTPNLADSFGTYVNAIIEMCTQSVNFLHFVIGDALVIITPLAIALVPIRLMVAPVIAFLRGFIRWGG